MMRKKWTMKDRKKESKKLFDVGTLAIGICPHCKETCSFIPTQKPQLYTCANCFKDVAQHVNGKIHWCTVAEMDEIQKRQVKEILT